MKTNQTNTRTSSGIFRRRNNSDPRRDQFLEVARGYLGYRTRPSGLSDFAVQTGYKGHAIPWSGAFVDVVARNAEIFMPACVYTSSGLAEFTHSRRIVSEPQPGDVVFYAFPTTDQFGMPHCGIVTDVSTYRETDTFMAIEGQVSSGLPRASQSADGVFERVRWRYDVLAFARPDFSRILRRPGVGNENADGLPYEPVRTDRVRPGRRGQDVQVVQNALTRIAGLGGHEPGVFDAATQRAYSRWQRQIGTVYPDCTGVPDLPSLRLLGQVAESFYVETREEN
jgi:hypothetical protein